MNFIDTSPFYGRGMSEVLLGVASGIARDKYILGTKLGRYAGKHFDFSAKRPVVESVDISLERMGVEYLDICLCHDLEFVEMRQIVEETLPALRKVQEQGKVRFVGVSGYPMKMFKYVLDHAPLDVMLSYNHYTLQNTMLADFVPYLKSKQVGIMNAAPRSRRLCSPMRPCLPGIKRHRRWAICKQAAEHCTTKGSDIAKLAHAVLHRESRHDNLRHWLRPIRGTVQQWAGWAAEPIDEQLLAEVLAILKPIHNWFYIEGRPENNDEPGH